MPLQPGDKLGPYEILAPIGAGGMGEVYKAYDPRLRRNIAIKVSAAQFTERFEREAQAIAALNHSHICQVYDVGPNYLVMEYIGGDPLKGPLPLEKALEYAGQIASALDAAHAKNITHRDLKPANILVTTSGVKLLDFGLAKVASRKSLDDATQTMALTEAGAVMGTAAYMSPEQAKGEEVDARSDIFSFGAVLYEMLSGHRAFARNSPVETMSAILRDDPAPLTQVSDAPANISSVVTRCLRKAAGDRFQTMSEVRLALELAAAKPLKSTTEDKPPSIAVLPFANMSGDKENEYFSDGLAEEILNLLAKIPGLKVIARTSSFAFRGKEQDIRKIAETLGVSNVLEGSVRKAGSRIRVTAQLIHAQDGTHTWSERYDRDLTDVFAIQDEIGRAISEALKVRLAPRTQVVNIEAWQLCLKGEYHRLRYTPESLAKAKEYFEQAIAIEPNYADAHNKLAMYYHMLGLVGIKPIAETAPLAKAAAAKALEMDPANQEVHRTLGVLAAAYDHDWKAAESHVRTAMASEPIPPASRYVFYAYYLLPLNRVPEALEHARLALELDPLSMLLHFGMAWCLYCASRYRESAECARRALEIDPNSYFIWHVLGLAQLSAGLSQEAVASLERSVDLAPWYHIALGSLAAAHDRIGDRERSRELGRKLVESHPYTVGAALYHSAVGEVDAMFEALEGAYQQRDVFLLYSRCLFLDPYRSDTRYKALLAKMNLA
jgi:TolB-like protein/predicted Ser/Thr protein kinase